jgi:pimeloyl-ACP methyl ester carboxylesterase
MLRHMRKTIAAGLEVAYRRGGHGAPLVLLHGILSDSRAWKPQLEGLSDEFDVIAWDAPGAGGSSDPPEPFTMADWADCLAEFLVAVEADAAHVLGLSWGGVLAQELYRRHPGCVSSLILADTYAGWKGSLPEGVWQERLAACLREAGQEASEFLPQWMPGLLAPDAPTQVRDELAAVISDFHPTGYRLMGQAVAASDQRDLLPRIAVPTLLIWGEDDARSTLAVARQLDDAIPGASLVVIQGAGHVSNIDRPDRFNAEVRRFLSGARPRGGPRRT